MSLSIRPSSDWGTEKQMEMAGEYPDAIIACFGGGSNFGGIAFPFMRHTILEGKKTRYIAAEPASCPKLTRGKFEYDYGDEAGYTPAASDVHIGTQFYPCQHPCRRLALSRSWCHRIAADKRQPHGSRRHPTIGFVQSRLPFSPK